MKTDSCTAWGSIVLTVISLFFATATVVPGGEVRAAGIAALCAQCSAALAVRARRKREVGLVILLFVAYVWLLATLGFIASLAD